MAKYVGKIFNVGNNKLKLRGNDSHSVYVESYNFKNHLFKCKIITSLEDEYLMKNVDKNFLKNRNHFFNTKTKKHCVLNQDKYKKLRRGVIEPIPMNKTENFNVWSGFSKTIYLKRKDFKKESIRKIKKEKD